MTAKVNLTDVEKNIFEAVDKNDVASLRTLLTKDQKVNIFDENCMTPLQHAAYKGNKEIVQILLDQVMCNEFIQYLYYIISVLL